MSMDDEVKKRFNEARKRLEAKESELRAQLDSEIRTIRERTVRKLAAK